LSENRFEKLPFALRRLTLHCNSAGFRSEYRCRVGQGLLTLSALGQETQSYPTQKELSGLGSDITELKINSEITKMTRMGKQQGAI
jgi:hypothetical protein